MRLAAPRERLATAVRQATEELSGGDGPNAGRAHLRLVGNELTIIGRDDFTTASATLQVEGLEDGAACVDQRRLDDFLHRSVGEDVRLATSVSRGHVRLQCGAATVGLPFQNTTVVFPVPGVTGIRIAGQTLTRVLRRVLPCAHLGSTHPALWGVHLVCGAGVMTAEACDAQRSARASEPFGCEFLDVVLNRRLVSKFVALAGQCDAVMLQDMERHVRAELENIVLVGLKPHGPFPALGVAFDALPTSSADVSMSDLRQAVETLRIVEDDIAVNLKLSKGTLRLSVRSPEGVASYPVRCDLRGPPIKRSVSLRGLRAACQTIELERVQICAVEAVQPMIRVEDPQGTVVWALASRAD